MGSRTEGQHQEMLALPMAEFIPNAKIGVEETPFQALLGLIGVPGAAQASPHSAHQRPHPRERHVRGEA